VKFRRPLTRHASKKVKIRPRPKELRAALHNKRDNMTSSTIPPQQRCSVDQHVGHATARANCIVRKPRFPPHRQPRACNALYSIVGADDVVGAWAEFRGQGKHGRGQELQARRARFSRLLAILKKRDESRRRKLPHLAVAMGAASQIAIYPKPGTSPDPVGREVMPATFAFAAH